MPDRISEFSRSFRHPRLACPIHKSGLLSGEHKMKGSQSQFPFSYHNIPDRSEHPWPDNNAWRIAQSTTDTSPYPTKYVIIENLLQPDGRCVDWRKFGFKMANPSKMRCAASSEKCSKK